MQQNAGLSANLWRIEIGVDEAFRGFRSDLIHCIDPLAYLRDVLTRLPAIKNHPDELAALCPPNWKPSPLKNDTNDFLLVI